MSKTLAHLEVRKGKQLLSVLMFNVSRTDVT